MRRLLAVLAAPVAALIVACGGSQPHTPAPAGAPASSAAAATPA
jgi:hypothetical protein